MDNTNFLSELERCIIANSSSPPELRPTTYSSDDLASMYLSGEFDPGDDYMYDDDDDDDDYDDEEDMIQIVYIDDSNFSKLSPDELKKFIENLSTILGTEAYTEEEILKFLQQSSKKPKE